MREKLEKAVEAAITEFTFGIIKILYEAFGDDFLKMCEDDETLLASVHLFAAMGRDGITDSILKEVTK